jgi:5-hydroxyisourate hydrolase
MMISTDVTDTARGLPAPRVPVELDLLISGEGWHEVGRAFTDADGWIDDFGEPAAPGVYRLSFDVASYQPDAFFPSVAITFEVRDPADKYHIPLLLSPFGYSTYRGSA